MSVASKCELVRLEKKHLRRCYEVSCEHFKTYDKYLDRVILPMVAPLEEDLTKTLDRANIVGYAMQERETIGDVSVGKIQGFVIFENRKTYLKVMNLAATPEHRSKAFPMLISRLDEFLGGNGGITSVVITIRDEDTVLRNILEKSGYFHAETVSKGDENNLVFTKSIADSAV